MTSTTYIPRTGSLADRVLGYLRANPDEELTTRDISVKFDVPQSSIKPCLATAENHGELDYTRNEDLEYVYRLPKQPKAPKSSAPPPAEPARAKTSKHSPTPGPRGPIVTPSAIEALAVEEDVDVAAANKRPGQNKWDPLMAKLTKAGQSIAIPQEWYRPLQSEVGKRNRRNKGTGPQYLCGFDAAGQPRIKRTA